LHDDTELLALMGEYLFAKGSQMRSSKEDLAKKV
jgi:hypothetical protein